MALANITSKIRANLIAKTFGKEFNASMKVLDIGCGTGVVVKRLGEIFNFKKIEGCDIENYLLENIHFKIQNQINKLPYSKKIFDVAMFNDVLHHTDYKNQENIIRESMRVSKKVLIFELIPNKINMVGDKLLNRIHNPNMEIPFTYRSPSEWIKLIKGMGYKVKKISVKRPVLYPFLHVGFVVTR